MIQPQVTHHPASVDAYIRHGWSLVPIPSGTKGPRNAGWNIKANALKDQTQLPSGFGIGLAHAYSGTMALDIDEWDSTSTALLQRGINLQALYDANDAVIVDSGRAGHGKLLYAMPFGLALPSKKIIINGVTAYELRCATANGLTVQDVLPPSIHPETLQPYRWAGKGHWTRLPVCPQPLLDLWQGMLAQDSERTIGTGDAIDTSWAEISNAMEHISSDCSREDWINVGMALHWAGTQTQQVDQGLHLWNEWSRPSTKYPGEREILQQWQSFRSDKTTAVKLGTLFHIARKAGWTRPMPDATSMFSAVEPLTPNDITTSLRPPPPDINLDLFPPLLKQRAKELSKQMGADPLLPLFGGLGAICGAIDARSRLELLSGFQVPPVLWIMSIGDPAEKKSPASKPMIRPLVLLEMEDVKRYQHDLLEWEGHEAAHASSKKAYLEYAGTPEFMLSKDQAPGVVPLPPKPASVKITVTDITSQKLVRMAADRPRGLLCYLDEMGAWVKKMTDKTSGEDRSCWVVSYEADRYEMERVGAGSICAENLAISIFGNIQPRVFREGLSSMSSDGLLQRFIPVILRRGDWGIGEDIPEYLTGAAAWENTLRMVFALPPTTYKLQPDAYNVYREFQQWYAQTKRDEYLLMSNDTFMTAFGKLEGLVGRLALVFHVMENPFSTMVSADTMTRVIELVKSYVIPSLRYALGELSGTDLFDQWVADYIIQYSDTSDITMSDIRRGARRQLEGKSVWVQDQMILSAMFILEQSKWVARMDDGKRENQHHAQWAINPTLAERFTGHHKDVIMAKQRQREHIYKLSKKPVKPVHGFDPTMTD